MPPFSISPCFGHTTQAYSDSFVYFWVFWGTMAFFMVILHIVRMCCRLVDGLRPLPAPAESTYKKDHSADFKTCSICLEDYEDGDTLHWLPCSHAYHADCIDTWIAGGHMDCPLCATDIKSTPDENTPLLRSPPPATSLAADDESRH